MTFRILFRGNNIYLHEDGTNIETPIHCLVNYLKQFDVWSSYEKVPEEFYHAWKILILGSNEYDENAIRIIKYANTSFLEKESKIPLKDDKI